MAKLKFKDENNNFIPVVQNVKVNNNSVFDGKDANIQLKTINNQNIAGSGNIEIDVSDVVKTTANQGLTTQQKLNARNNIEALGNSNIKQGTGTSTTDVISQKGITDLLAEKQSRVPNGTNPLIALDTGKIDLVYMPATVLGGITNGGTFNSQGIINASSYAPELQGEKIDEVQFASYPSYYFICSDNYSFAGFDFTVGDWAISLGNGWAKLNATDAVTSVNGKMGQVVLNADDVQAVPLWFGIDNANKNLVTDYLGMVTTSDYALGQIIVDYFEELPTDVPVTAKASVINSSSYMGVFTEEEIEDSINNGTIYDDFFINETIIKPTSENAYVSVANETGNIDMNYGMSGGATEPVFALTYTDENGNSHEYYYSFIRQEYAYSGEEIVYLEIGWNEVLYDEETGEPYITQIQHSDLPALTNFVFTSYSDEDTGFINSFGHTAYHLAGEYMYVETQPSTTPKTYYWKYSPANVQADMSEDEPSSLAYIKNRAVLDTTNTNGLPIGSETIKNTIYLHKIAKTGNYNDLINAVGRTSGNGEKLGNYSTNLSRGLYGLSTGSNTQAEGNYSRAGGYYSTASGEKSVAEGYGAVATGEGANAKNINTLASGKASSAEGDSTIAASANQHVQGKYNVSDNQGNYAHIVGNGTADNARSNAHTVDWNGNAWFKGNIRVGGTSYDTGSPLGGVGEQTGSTGGEIFNSYSGTTKNQAGTYSHAEGYNTSANGDYAHAEGNGTRATGNYSHAEGNNTASSVGATHSEGVGTIAASYAQHVQGTYNVMDTSQYLHIVGNGTDDNNRSNAHTLDRQGNAWFAGNIRVGGTSWDTGTPIGGGGSTPKKKTLTEASQNYSVSNNVVTVTDNDVTASTTDVVLYPENAATETWLENNLSSCIITQAAGSFSFTINSSLPSTFSMYYIITEVE